MDKDFLKLAIQYKDEYDSLPWWKFKKRAQAKANWYSARDLMVRFGLRRQEEERIKTIVCKIKQ